MYTSSVFLLIMKLFLQHANNVLSDCPGQVDFPAGLEDSLLHLPNGQAVSWENFYGNSAGMNKYCNTGMRELVRGTLSTCLVHVHYIL